MAFSEFAQNVQQLFERKFPGAHLFLYEEIDSTNNEAKAHARASAEKNDSVFIAFRQTAGRGRMGRSFLSPAGGLYTSILMYPSLNANEALKLTAIAAVAVCDTIKELTNLSPRIKWVNDVYLGNKKVCGILTEGEFCESEAKFKYAVVGIGINVVKTDFPDGLKDIATDIESACGKKIDLSMLVAGICKRMFCLDFKKSEEYMAKYREYSMLVGRRVKIIRGDESFVGRVVNISDDGFLELVTEDGEKRLVTSGEASLKLDL